MFLINRHHKTRKMHEKQEFLMARNNSKDIPSSPFCYYAERIFIKLKVTFSSEEIRETTCVTLLLQLFCEWDYVYKKI